MPPLLLLVAALAVQTAAQAAPQPGERSGAPAQTAACCPAIKLPGRSAPQRGRSAPSSSGHPPASAPQPAPAASPPLHRRADAPSDADLLLAVKATFENGDQVLASWRNGTDVCAWRYISCGADKRPDKMCGTRERRPHWMPARALAMLPVSQRSSGSAPLFCTGRPGRPAPRPPPADNVGQPQPAQGSENMRLPTAPTAPPPPTRCCSALDGLGLIGQIPQPSGYIFPDSTTELVLGQNSIRGPIPPSWRLHEGETRGVVWWGGASRSQRHAGVRDMFARGCMRPCVAHQQWACLTAATCRLSEAAT